MVPAFGKGVIALNHHDRTAVLTHKLTTAMVASIRPVQDQGSPQSSMEGKRSSPTTLKGEAIDTW